MRLTPGKIAGYLVSAWLETLGRLSGHGADAHRLAAHDVPALLDREDVLIIDTETTGVGASAEVIEILAIDTTGALRLNALAIPVGPISRKSREIHGLSEDALHTPGARAWPDVHEDMMPVLLSAQTLLA